MSKEPRSKRFREAVGQAEMEDYTKGVVPENTKKNDTWALNTLKEWLQQRNSSSSASEEACPEDILSSNDPSLLDKWLSLFTIEVRRKDGTEYPPATIHMLLCGLQRIMRRNNEQPFNIFAKGDVRFRNFHGTMETVFQELHQKGIGANVKHASEITAEEEDRVWTARVMGDHSPTALLRAVFYLNGVNFSLRGGKEHRDLKLSQLVRESDHWKYIEHGSKCFRGGFGDLHRENKVVVQYPILCHERCHVRLLDLYMSKLHPDATEKDIFYYTPLHSKPSDPSKPWYSLVPVGWNKLNGMVNAIFSEVGITGKTNHSLRVTGATRMYNGGVGEKTIQSRTGHKSLEALRVYERPSREEHMKACDVLSNAPSTTSNVPIAPIASSTDPGIMSMSNIPVAIASTDPTSTPGIVFNNCTFNLHSHQFTQNSQLM